MSHLYMSVAGTTILLNAFAATCDFVKAGFVVKTSAQVGVPRSWLPLLGVLKSLGAIGLALGLLGFSAMGTAAAAGLVAFFIGAIGFHVRARVLYNVAFPVLFLALAAASLVLSTA